MSFHVILAALCLALISLAASGQTPTTRPATVADGRRTISLNEGWQFHKGDLADAALPATPDSGNGWEKINVPHTWNALDGQDGGNDYFKGDCWYRRHVTVDDAMKGKSLYIRFEAVNRKAEVFINGTSVGTHAGGQAAFVFDVTKALKPGDNLIAVRASNKVDQDMPPLQADFTFFGGIYRPVQLLVLDPVHISPLNHASSGVFISAPRFEKGEAVVDVRAIVRNDSDQPFRGRYQVQVNDDKGHPVAGQGFNFWNESVIQPSKEQNADEEVGIADPHLWNGRRDPYLYTVVVTISKNNPDGTMTVLDSVTQPLGIRTIAVDPVKGFLLNGKPYDLHGVNRHQEVMDKGWALSDADHLRDMALIKELGCTAIRLAHYQHSQFFYDLCDKEGILVWAEVPVVDKLGAGPAFTENAKQQYTELIRQNFNHPSIAFWSAGNEVDESGNNFNRNGPQVYPWFKEQSALGHKEDPSRLTASAWREKFFPPAGTTDVIGLNEYLGWYTGGGPGNNSGWEGLETYIANHSDPAKGGIKGGWAITEYGAGASIYFHSEKPIRMDHSEEYQALLHENTWKVFSRHPEIWGKFVWAMFDFASDSRAEGDHAGINDKGLVTHDRKVKKDAFYFYKAVWSNEPTLQITSKRFAVRGLEKIPVKVYTNATKVALSVNGTVLEEKTVDNGTVLWEGVTLKPGQNQIIATGVGADGKPMEDRCTWIYTPGAPTEVDEAQDQRMKDALKNGPPRAK